MQHILFLFLTDGWLDFDLDSFRQQFWDNTVNGLTFGAIYALIAMGYTLV